MNVADWGLYHYTGTLVRAVDGDTVIVELQLGLRVATTVSLRIAGINAPELHRGTEEERAAGVAARDFVARYEGDRVWVQTHKDGRSFNRYIAAVYIVGEGELHDVAMLIVDAGHAVRV